MKRASKTRLTVFAILVTALAIHSYSHYRRPLPPTLLHAVVSFRSIPKAPLSEFPVVKGGVHSVAAVLAWMKQGFYASVDAGTLHEVVNKRDFLAFTQYYRNGKLLWSSRPTLIRAGEILYCDDSGHCIRAICGNLLSLTAVEPTAADLEPLLDEAVDVPAPPLLLPIGESLPFPPPAAPFTPFVPPQGGYPPFVSPPCCIGGGDSPKNVSEPGSLLLTSAGLLFVLYFALRYKSKRKGQI